MRRFAASALLVMAAIFPVFAQHGGHAGVGGGFHGGFTSHSAPSMQGGSFRSSAPRSFASAARPGYRGTNFGVSGARPVYSSANRGNRVYGSPAYGNPAKRQPYRPPYRPGSGLGFVPGFAYGGGYYPGYSSGWIGSDDLGYSDDSGYDISTTDPNADPNAGYDTQPMGPDGDEQNPVGQNPGDQYQVRPDPQEMPYYRQPMALPRPSPAPQRLDAVTLVFKDGRPREQVHNYVLSRTTLSVLDSGPAEHHRDIPVDQLDLAATEKANREAGVGFRLPEAVR